MIDVFDLYPYNATVDLAPNEVTAHFAFEQGIPLQDFELRYQLSSEELGLFGLSTYLPDSLNNCDSFFSSEVVKSFVLEPSGKACVCWRSSF